MLYVGRFLINSDGIFPSCMLTHVTSRTSESVKLFCRAKDTGSGFGLSSTLTESVGFNLLFLLVANPCYARNVSGASIPPQINRGDNLFTAKVKVDC